MEKIRNIKATGMEMVVQDNKLVDSPRFLTLQEQRLFLLLVSKINPLNPEDITFRLPVTEFAKALGIDEKDAMRDLRKVTKDFMKRVIEVRKESEEGRSTAYIHIVSYAEYWHGKGYADIKISDEIAPFLFQLKERYTKYKLSQITSLSSVFAIRIYEILKRNEKMRERKVFISDLRKMLAITDKQYTRFNDFKRKVLDIAIREINAKTDLLIDYKLVKCGRKFEVVEFSIQPKDDSEKIYTIEYNGTRYYDQKLIDKMISLGVKPAMAEEWFDRYSPRDIENAIAVVLENTASGKCDNPAGMLKTAIQKRWKTLSNIKIDQISETDEETEEVMERKIAEIEQKAKKSSKKQTKSQTEKKYVSKTEKKTKSRPSFNLRTLFKLFKS